MKGGLFSVKRNAAHMGTWVGWSSGSGSLVSFPAHAGLRARLEHYGLLPGVSAGQGVISQ